MATVTKTFAFATTAEGFVATPGTSVTLSYDGATGNPAGALKSTLATKSRTGASYWEWSGTWEALGVPTGAIVTAVALGGASVRCTQFTSATSAKNGPYELRDSAGTLLGTLWAGRTATAVDAAWVAVAAQASLAVPAAQRPSNTTVRIRLNSTLVTPNTTGATVTTYDDQVALTFTYTPTANLTVAATLGPLAATATLTTTPPTPTPTPAPTATYLTVFVPEDALVDLADPVNRHHPLNHGRVAWWLTLSEVAGGTIWYDLLGLYHGTLIGHTTVGTTGWRGTTRPGGRGELLGDGTATRTEVPGAAALDIETFTIACWFRTTSASPMILLEKWDLTTARYPYSLRLSTGVLSLLIYDGSLNPSVGGGPALNDGVWHHGAATRSKSGAMLLYIDGVRVASSSDTAADTTNDNRLGIGDRAGTVTIPFAGSIDDVSIWSRILPDAVVAELYRLSRVGYPGLLNRLALPSFAPVPVAPGAPVAQPAVFFAHF